MTPTSRGQVTRTLARFAADGGPDRFDIGALDHSTGRMSLRDDWNRSQIGRATAWMAARNTTGSSIYVRPARGLTAHPWILIDDLTADAIEKVRRTHPPGIVVETSPGNFQAWIRVQRAVRTGARTAIARTLMQTYGGDPGGVGGDQFGRMPGTTNQKPERRGPKHAPFAQLRHAGPEVVNVIIPDDDSTTRAPPEAAGGRTPNPTGVDQSARDFALACRLIEVGRHDDEIAAAIVAIRAQLGSAKAHRADYIDRTIRAARRHLAEKKC